jgi:hypothetical protein
MNVGELIAELQKLDPNLPVIRVDGEQGEIYEHSGIGRRWVKVTKHAVSDDYGPADVGDTDAVLAVEL